VLIDKTYNKSNLHLPNLSNFCETESGLNFCACNSVMRLKCDDVGIRECYRIIILLCKSAKNKTTAYCSLDHLRTKCTVFSNL